MGEARMRMATGTMLRRYGPRMQNLAITAIVFVSSFTLFPQTANAQLSDSENITLSPTSSQYTVDVGGTIKNKLTVVNDSKDAYDFIVYARPYSVANNEYSNPDFTNVTKTADLYAWVQFPQTKYRAASNSTTYVDYSINIPSGASPGGHYGVIFVEVQPAQQQVLGNAIIRKKRVGSLVYTTVNGDVKLSGDVAQGGDIPFWQVQPPLKTTVAAKNTGNTHFSDKTTLTVTDIFGNTKYQTKKDYVILPNTTRTMTSEWPQAPWFGLFKATTEQHFLDKSFKSDGYVLIMPRYLPVALIVIVVIGGVYAVARRKKK